MIFDSQSQKLSLKKYLSQPDGDSFNAYLIEGFLEKLRFLKKVSRNALFVGKYHPTHLRRFLSPLPGKAYLEFPDLLPGIPQKSQAFYQVHPPKKTEYDVLLHNNLHQQNHLEKSLQSLFDLLKPKGIFLGSFFGEYTLKELRDSALKTEELLGWPHTPRVSPFLDAQGFTQILQSQGFQNIVVDKERLKLKYDSLASLLRDIRQSGEKNMLTTRQSTFLGKQFLPKLNDVYQHRFGNPSLTFPVTLDILHFFAEKPSTFL